MGYLDQDVLREVRSVREFVHGLQLQPNSVVTLRSQLERRGIRVEADDGAGGGSRFRVIHEVVEARYLAHVEGLTRFGREAIASEGAAEALAPADECRDVIAACGWDVAALHARFRDRGATWEVCARRLPLLAAEDDVELAATIVSDGRVRWSRSSAAPLSQALRREMLVPEVDAWLECVRSDPRADVDRTVSLCHHPIRLACGRLPHMPDPDEATELLPDARGLVSVRVRVWAIPPHPAGKGPRREVVVAVIES